MLAIQGSSKVYNAKPWSTPMNAGTLRFANRQQSIGIGFESRHCYRAGEFLEAKLGKGTSSDDHRCGGKE